MESCKRSRAGNVCLGACALILASLCASAIGQTQTPDKTLANELSEGGAYDSFARVGVLCGGGTSFAPSATKPTVQCGGVFGLPYFDLEGGIMGPQVKRTGFSPYLSTNAVIPMGNPRSTFGAPLLVGGYTHFFGVGHAVDYGVALSRPVNAYDSIQFEVRDYWEVSRPSQHNIVIRVVWLWSLPDC